MSSARKIIDWRRQHPENLAESLGDLPDGRYVLVPESEVAAQLSVDDAERLELEALQAGIDQAEAGATIAWTDVRRAMDAMIARASGAR